MIKKICYFIQILPSSLHLGYNDVFLIKRSLWIFFKCSMDVQKIGNKKEQKIDLKDFNLVPKCFSKKNF